MDDLSKYKLVNQSQRKKTSVFLSNDNMILINPNPITLLDQIKLKDNIFNNNNISKYTANINTTGEVVIYSPISQEELVKINEKNKRIIETYKTYIDKTLPIAIKQNKKWIYNILEKKQESESIIFENDNFILIPDLKWDKINRTSMYFLAIVKRRDLYSIRELTSKELPLLKDIYYTGLNVIKKKYNKDASEFRVYFHYHPTYWHLHIHFNLLNNSISDASVDNCHLLLNVIENIKIYSDYYQKVNIEIIEKVLLH